MYHLPIAASAPSPRQADVLYRGLTVAAMLLILVSLCV